MPEEKNDHLAKLYSLKKNGEWEDEYTGIIVLRPDAVGVITKCLSNRVVALRLSRFVILKTRRTFYIPFRSTRQDNTREAIVRIEWI